MRLGVYFRWYKNGLRAIGSALIRRFRPSLSRPWFRPLHRTLSRRPPWGTNGMGKKLPAWADVDSNHGHGCPTPAGFRYPIGPRPATGFEPAVCRLQSDRVPTWLRWHGRGRIRTGAVPGLQPSALPYLSYASGWTRGESNPDQPIAGLSRVSSHPFAFGHGQQATTAGAAAGPE